MPIVPVPTMLSLIATAEKSGLSYDFLRKACLSGKIVHIRVGNRYLINYEKLIEWLETAKGE